MKPLRRSYLWLAALILLLACSFFLDRPIHQWVLAHVTDTGTAIARQLSFWGDTLGHVITGVVGLVVALLLRNRAWALIFAAMLLASAFAGIVSPTIKSVAGRSRPNVTTQIGWNGPSLGQKQRSFPSGHTLNTFAFFGALFLARRRLGLALLPIPIAIALSRIYLNAHYVSDVVFGAALGVCCALLSWRVVRKWEETRGAGADSPLNVER